MINDIRKLELDAGACGLTLNHSKCEVISLSPSNRHPWDASGFSFFECPLEDATLLGSPIQPGTGVNKTAGQEEDLSSMVGRLSLMPAHFAHFLLRNALSIPKLFYTLRTAPCSDSPELLAYDDTLKSSLATILNISLHYLSPSAWNQASLPLRWSGIGVRSGTSASTVRLPGFRCWCR